MQHVNGLTENFGQIHFVNETDNIITGQGDYGALKRSAADAFESDSDSEHQGKRQLPPNPNGSPKPGKKTRGRVKIEMRFIENKLRRYTTFSKRKTGIMKKAYELSTLTGTQVMLLVASETGHVYTFATRKLQPMITSESGKALIQTCLNSPDVGGAPGIPPPSGNGSDGGLEAYGDQRMNPGGFEEPELSYAVEEDQPKVLDLTTDPGSPALPKSMGVPVLGISPSPSPNPPYNMARTPFSDSSSDNNMQHVPAPAITLPLVMPTAIPSASTPASSASGTVSINSYLGPALGQTAGSSGKQVATNMTMQLPTGGMATIIPPTAGLPPGLTFTSPFGTSPQGSQTPTMQFKLPMPGTPGGQIISLQGFPMLSPPTSSTAATTTSSSSMLSASESRLAIAPPATAMPSLPTSAPAASGTPMMFQTPQGMVMAAPSGMSLPEGLVFNMPQTPTLAMPTLPAPTQEGGKKPGSQPQFITIPVPVSLAAGQQMFPQFQAQSHLQAAQQAAENKPK